MLREIALSGNSDMWAEYNAWQDERNFYRDMHKRAEIALWVCIKPGGKLKHIQFTDQTLPRLTSAYGRNCTQKIAQYLPRMNEWLETYPNAQTLRPDLYDDNGQPFRPMYRQYDSRTGQGDQTLAGAYMGWTQDQIQNQIDDMKAQATILKESIMDWLYLHGINGHVMDHAEIQFYIDKINGAEAGNAMDDEMIDRTAPGVPGSGDNNRPPPDTGGGLFDLDQWAPAKIWPGLAVGALLAFLRG